MFSNENIGSGSNLHIGENIHDDHEDKFIKDQAQKTVEEIIDQDIGGGGKYQLKTFFLFSLHILSVALFLMVPGLLFQQPKFLCMDKFCSVKQYCSYSNYKMIDQEKSVKSITYDFELYCEKDYLNHLGKALPYIGSMFGLLVLMPLSDNQGRKKAIGAAWLCITVGLGLVSLFQTRIVMVFVGLFLAGFGATPILNLEQIYINEVTSGHFRSFSVCLLYVVWSVSELLIYPLTLISSDWKIFSLYFMFIPATILNLVYFSLLESPQYTYHKSIEQTIKILNFMANFNNKNKSNQNNQKVINQIQDHDLVQLDPQSKRFSKYSVADLFRYKSLRKLTFLLIIISIGGNAALYGIQFSLSLFGSNFAVNSFYVGWADLFGYLIANFAGHKCKRKKWTIFSLCLTSILCMASTLFPIPENTCTEEHQKCWQKTLQIWEIILARFSISIFTSFLALWRTELYPTTIRSIGIGFVGAIGVIGAQIIPIFELVAYELGISSVFLLGAACIVTAFSGFGLQETKGQTLLEQIKEIRDGECPKTQQENGNSHPMVLEFQEGIHLFANHKDESSQYHKHSEEYQQDNRTMGSSNSNKPRKRLLSSGPAVQNEGGQNDRGLQKLTNFLIRKSYNSQGGKVKLLDEQIDSHNNSHTNSTRSSYIDK